MYKKRERYKKELKEDPSIVASPEKTTTLFQEMFYLLRKLLVLVLIIIFLTTVFFGVTRNTDLGMNPAIKHGDLVFYHRMAKNYTAPDVITIKVEGRVQLCRIVAVAGDIVDITEAGLLINGAVQQEPEVLGETLAFSEGITFPVTLGQGQVFLLGDNREVAVDSRLYGVTEVEDILGKVMLVLRCRNI